MIKIILIGYLITVGIVGSKGILTSDENKLRFTYVFGIAIASSVWPIWFIMGFIEELIKRLKA
jgi:arginine exporter protein ArgO